MNVALTLVDLVIVTIHVGKVDPLQGPRLQLTLNFIILGQHTQEYASCVPASQKIG